MPSLKNGTISMDKKEPRSHIEAYFDGICKVIEVAKQNEVKSVTMGDVELYFDESKQQIESRSAAQEIEKLLKEQEAIQHEALEQEQEEDEEEEYQNLLLTNPSEAEEMLMRGDTDADE